MKKLNYQIIGGTIIWLFLATFIYDGLKDTFFFENDARLMLFIFIFCIGPVAFAYIHTLSTAVFRD